MPTKSKYGGWPRSGEIDMMEGRGNRNYTNHLGKQIGVEQIATTLHFGPAPNINGWSTATCPNNSAPGHGFNRGFHKYQMEWTPTYLKFSYDDKETVRIDAGNGFWERANFTGENIWKNGTKMAPFDEEVNLQLFSISFDCTQQFPIHVLVLYYSKFGCWRRQWLFPRYG